MNRARPAADYLSTRRRMLTLLAGLPLIAWAGTETGRQWLAALPEIPDVMLIDSEGVEHRLSTLVADRPVAIGFFFTGCSTVCPLQTALFHRVQQRLSHGLLLSISLDPFNDTPPVMHAYADKFKAKLGLQHRWLMLSGDRAALQQVWKAFDNDNGSPEAHAANLWVGSPRRRHWVRLNGFTTAGELTDWMAASDL